MLSRMPHRHYSRGPSTLLFRTRFATALLALTSTSTRYTAFCFSLAAQHPTTSATFSTVRSIFGDYTSRGGGGGASLTKRFASTTTTDEMAKTKAATPQTAGQKLIALRSKLEELDLDVYLVPVSPILLLYSTSCIPFFLCHSFTLFSFLVG